MKTTTNRLVRINDAQRERHIAYNATNDDDDLNEYYERERRRKLKIANNIINTLLTPKERELYVANVINKIPQVELATQYGVNKSTISRNIMRAKNKIQRYVGVLE